MTENTAKKENFQYLDEDRIEEIHEAYKAFGLLVPLEYPGAERFARQLEQVSLLDFTNITFTTTGNTVSPFVK